MFTLQVNLPETKEEIMVYLIKTAFRMFVLGLFTYVMFFFVSLNDHRVEKVELPGFSMEKK